MFEANCAFERCGNRFRSARGQPAQSSDKSFLIFCKTLLLLNSLLYSLVKTSNDSLLYTQTQWQFRLTIKKKVVTRRDYNENDDGVDNDVYTKKTQWKRK